MKITYKFVTGEIVEVEVPEEVGEVSIEIDREIRNSDRRETRRHNTLSVMEEKGFQFEDETNVEEQVDVNIRDEKLNQAIEKLLPKQKELVQKVFYEDTPIVEIAREEGVSEAAIRNRLKKIYTKLEKMLD